MKTFDITTPFKTKYITAPKGVRCVAVKYTNGQNALQIRGLDGEALSTASVALDHSQPKDEIFIKDWSENEGMLDELIKHGIVGKPIEHLATGYVAAMRCKLLKPEYWENE